MTVRDLYEDAIFFEESTLAYCILHLIQEGKVSLDDDESKLDFNEIDNKKVKELILKNPLGFSRMKIFSLKYSNTAFVFVFAKSKKEAINFFRKQFNKEPLNCHEMLMDKRISVGNRILTFREMRKEFNHFPAFAGIYDKRDGYTV